MYRRHPGIKLTDPPFPSTTSLPSVSAFPHRRDDREVGAVLQATVLVDHGDVVHHGAGAGRHVRDVEPEPGEEPHRGRVRVEQGAVGCPGSEEHTSELQSLMRTSYAVFCLKKKKHSTNQTLLI